MLHQIIFLPVLMLVPIVIMSPFVGVLIYKWLEDLPPASTYSVTQFENLSLIVGALTFFSWLLVDKKAMPKPRFLLFALIALLVWVNITTLFALVPDAAAVKWDRTVKVIAFAILTAQMLSTRQRLESFMWVFVLTVAYLAVPGAIKTIVGGATSVGSGEVVVAEAGSFFGDRVIFSVVLAMALPFILYLRRQATLLPKSRWLKLATLGTAGGFLIALVGTYARTALIVGSVTLLMLIIKSRRRAAAASTAAVIVLALLALAPDSWFARMNTTVNYQQDESAEARVRAWGWAWNMALAHPIVGGGFRVFVLDAAEVGGGGYTEAHNIFFEMMAEHGFVGLGLFCWVIGGTYWTCSAIPRRVIGIDELAWTADLARSVQVALVTFTVGGMFVSIATSAFFYDLVAIAIGVRALVEREFSATKQRLPLVQPEPLPLH
jgi:probable O-glycosylation ligase (exosortase A-associated)